MESRPHMLWESDDWSSGGMLYLAATEMTLSTGWDVSCDVPQNNCLGWRHYCSYTCNWILLDGAKSSHSSLERVNHNLLCNVSDEKPFKCSQCESSFRKSSGLKQHVTRQHSQNTAQKSTQAQANQASNKKNSSANDRPYACQVTLTSPPVRKAYFTIHPRQSLGMSGNSQKLGWRKSRSSVRIKYPQWQMKGSGLELTSSLMPPC